ncbi:hypothetical protein EJ03DRAFT_123381 [Teratosphaeria nubilosa]|uniref:Uncharacterized protein n=1 Tax=Teratosphaeria nubilosa TaxID=161662 RepID=A0A6G1L5S0_9PEZI|nr:hypothetical protein EJ03DRAFT_123381 [Teratosphaeria nubilosa]
MLSLSTANLSGPTSPAFHRDHSAISGLQRLSLPRPSTTYERCDNQGTFPEATPSQQGPDRADDGTQTNGGHLTCLGFFTDKVITALWLPPMPAFPLPRDHGDGRQNARSQPDSCIWPLAKPQTNMNSAATSLCRNFDRFFASPRALLPFGL